MLYRLLLILLTLAAYDAPARNVPQTFDASTQVEPIEVTPDPPCFIIVNESGDVTETCP